MSQPNQIIEPLLNLSSRNRDGHATMVDEIAQDLGKVVPSMIITCCGGGGLVCGLVRGIRKHRWEDQTKILVTETVGTNSFNVSVKAGKLVRLEEITSIATCLSANEVCSQIVKDLKAGKPPMISRLVTDQDAVSACHSFANDHRFLVGTACGAALSAAYSGMAGRILNQDELSHETIYDTVNNLDFNHNTDGPIVIIVCGGSEISIESLKQMKKQFNC